MDANAVLERLTELEVSTWAEGGMVMIQQASKVPPELKAEVRSNKPELLVILAGPMGNGQAPPLDRPLKTVQELRRWMDHTTDPKAFTLWLAWATAYADPAG